MSDRPIDTEEIGKNESKRTVREVLLVGSQTPMTNQDCLSLLSSNAYPFLCTHGPHPQCHANTTLC